MKNIKSLISLYLIFAMILSFSIASFAITPGNDIAPIASVALADQDGEIVSPSSAEMASIDATMGQIEFEAIANGKNKIKFCLDGVAFKEFAPIDDSMYTYKAVCDLSDESLGIHEFSIVRTIGTVDVMIGKRAINLNGRYKGILQSDDGEGATAKGGHGIVDGIYPYDTETFEGSNFVIGGLWKMCRYSDHIHSQGATNDNTTFDIKSDEDSDGKYLSLESKSAAGPFDRYITLAQKGSGATMVPSQLGTWELEFDIKMSSDAGAFGFRGFPLWGSYDYFDYINCSNDGLKDWTNLCVFLTPDGKIRGTDVAYRRDEWHHFKLNYDNREATKSANGNRGIWNVWMDGIQVISNEKDNNSYAGDTHKNGIKMLFMDGYKDGSATLGTVCLDNLAISRQQIAPKIKSLSYDTIDSTGLTVLSNDIPQSAVKVNVELDKLPGNFSLSDVSLTKNGKVLDCTVSSSGNTLSISDYGKLTADDKLCISLALGDDSVAKSAKGQKDIAAYLNITHNTIKSVKARQQGSILYVTADFITANIDTSKAPIIVAYIYGPDNKIISLDTKKLASPYNRAELSLNLADYDQSLSKVRFFAFEGDYKSITYRIDNLVW